MFNDDEYTKQRGGVQRENELWTDKIPREIGNKYMPPEQSLQEIDPMDLKTLAAERRGKFRNLPQNNHYQINKPTINYYLHTFMARIFSTYL